MTRRLMPFQVSTSVDLKGGKLRIGNKTDNDWKNVVVALQDGYAQDIALCISDIKANQSVEIPVRNDLHFYHTENGLRLRLYSEQRTVYERTFNHNRKRAFVFYSNKGFEKITQCAIEGLRNFSELEVVYYTIGFDSDIRIPGVHCRRHDIGGPEDALYDSQYMQMIKPEMFLRALDDGIEDGLFIDSDVQVRHNIESVFERYSNVDRQTPVLNRNYWQFLFVGDKYIPQEELSRKMGYEEEKQFQGHGITNIFLLRKEMRPLFEKWRFWCREKEIMNDLRKKVYLHDEVIFNLLCWKEKAKQMQGNLLFNVKDLKDVKAFHHLRAEPGQSHLDFNGFGCGHLSQSFAPYDTDDVVGFHCVKDPETALSINDYLKSVSPALKAL
jgi:hypothetical protein